MSKNYWLSIPSDDPSHDWIGHIELPQESKKRIRIKVARRLRDRHELIAFSRRGTALPGKAVNAFLGMQSKCCLLEFEEEPKNDLSFFQIGTDRFNAIVTGNANFIVYGAWEIDDDCYFRKLSTRLLGLDSVLEHSRAFNENDLNENLVFAYCPAKGVEVTCKTSQKFHTNYFERTTTTHFQLTISLDRDDPPYQHAHLLRMLCQFFDILSGWSFKPEEALLRRSTFSHSPAARLEFHGHFYEISEPRHARFLSLSPDHIVKCLERVLSKRYNHLVDDLQTLHHWNFVTPYLEDKLYWGIPLLERQLKRNLQTSEEKSFIKLESEYHESVTSQLPQHLVDFHKKHVQIVDKKSRGLKQHCEEIASKLRAKGFPISTDFPEHLRLARSQLVHSASRPRDPDFSLVMVERQARFISLVTFYRELGIPFETMSDLKRCFFGSDQ